MRPLFFYLRNLNSYSLTVIVPKQKNIYVTINQQYNYQIKKLLHLLVIYRKSK